MPRRARELSLATMATKALVIAEHGTDWVRWARRLSAADTSETVVLMQDQAEDSDAFARRALARVERLIGSGADLTEAAFLSSDASTPAQRRERSRLVRSLSSLLSRSGSGRLYLEPATKTSAAGKRMLRALAWALNDLARGTGFTICVVGATGPLLN